MERWLKNEYLEPVVKLMVEGWSRNPKGRPTARKMKRDLAVVFEKCAQEMICDMDTPLTSPVTKQKMYPDAKYIMDNKRMGTFNRGSMGSRTSDYETDRGTNGSCSSGKLYGSLAKKQMMARDSPTLEHNYTIINKTMNSPAYESSDGYKPYFKRSLSWRENQKSADGSFII